MLKCQAWERKKGKTSLWPLRREESRAQNRSQPVSHLLLSRLSRGSVHPQLDPLSQFYKKVKLARDREGPLAFQLQAWSVSCLSSSTWNVKSMRYEVLRLWQVQLQLYSILLTLTRDTINTLHTSTLATAPSSRHLVQNKMNLDGWNDNFNCGVLVCIINKEVLYKTPPNGWSGGGWRCGPHFTFPHQTRVHWFVSPPRLGAWPVAMSSSGSAALSHSW